jgi:hypothetical protein
VPLASARQLEPSQVYVLLCSLRTETIMVHSHHARLAARLRFYARIDGPFEVTVTHRPGTTARVRIVTEVRITAGEQLVATATLGGRFSQAQALAEFWRLPGRFTPSAPFLWEWPLTPAY